MSTDNNLKNKGGRVPLKNAEFFYHSASRCDKVKALLAEFDILGYYVYYSALEKCCMADYFTFDISKPLT